MRNQISIFLLRQWRAGTSTFFLSKSAPWVCPMETINKTDYNQFVGGAVASWLVRSTPEQAVRVRALVGDIVLCSWARHFTLTVPLSTQVYKWVPANCWGNLAKLRGGVTCDGLASRPGEVEILLAASCYRNRDKLRQLWASLGSKASLLFYFYNQSRIEISNMGRNWGYKRMLCRVALGTQIVEQRINSEV